jgi:hypothetical protein
MEQLQQQVNQQDVLHRLLCMAVLRGHNTAAVLLCRMPALQQLSVDDASAVIALALSNTYRDVSDTPTEQVLEVLCQQLPAAQQLPVSLVIDMMHKVIDGAFDSSSQRSWPLLEALCRHLPAARQLPVSCVADMMHKVIDGRPGSSRLSDFVSLQATWLAVLCQHLPAAQHLPVSCMADMMHKVINGCLDSAHCVSFLMTLLEALCQHLSTAQQLPVSCVADMIHKVFDGGLDSPDHISLQRKLLEVLCQHVPAAQQLPVPCVVQLIYKVMKHPYHYGSTTAVAQHQGVDAMLQYLVALPAAQEMSQSTAEDILQLCMKRQVPYVFVRQPLQQLGVAIVRSLMFGALDWYR